MSAEPSRMGWIICGHERRVVLVVGVDHDHDVGTTAQRFEVARLLVAAIAAVLDVHDDFEPEAFGDVDRVVVADVVDQDDFIDDVHRQPAVGRLQSARRVVGGHDDDDAGASLHGGRDALILRGRRRPGRVCSPSVDTHAANRRRRRESRRATWWRRPGCRCRTRPGRSRCERPPPPAAGPGWRLGMRELDLEAVETGQQG